MTNPVENIAEWDIFELDNNNETNNVDTSFENIEIGNANNERNTLSERLSGARLERSNLSDDIKNKLSEGISAHKSSLGSSIGRKLMGFFHFVKKCFTFSSDGSIAVAKNKYTRKTNYIPSKPVNDKPISYSNDVVAKCLGLKEKDVQIKNWPTDLFPKGSPSLADIKQNPELQDCWFLSSLGTTLVSMGSDYIKSLITPAENGQGYDVRMGDQIINVPHQITSKSGKVTFSNSKPWVQVLETAMQLALIDEYKKILELVNANPDDPRTDGYGAKKPNMAYKNPTMGLNALLGRNIYNTNNLEMIGHVDQSEITKVKEIFKSNKGLVVLGSNSGAGAPLRDGISPQHAVSVIDYNEKSKKITVLDPYGHTRVISENSLAKNYTIIVAKK